MTMRMTPGQLRWFKAQFGASLMAAAAMLGTTEIAGGQGIQGTTTGKDRVTFTQGSSHIYQGHRADSPALMPKLSSAE
jgi:hypothetical protein